MKNIARYNQFIKESVNPFEDRPEIADFIEVLKERTYEFIDDEYNIFLYVKRKVNKGMFAKVFEYIIRSGKDNVLSFAYVSGERVDIPELEGLIFDIDIRDNWGDSIPASDPRMMELHAVLHYEFPKFNII
jgi:hypothetical protein